MNTTQTNKVDQTSNTTKMMRTMILISLGVDFDALSKVLHLTQQEVIDFLTEDYQYNRLVQSHQNIYK
jgi:hypothetical protein